MEGTRREQGQFPFSELTFHHIGEPGPRISPQTRSKVADGILHQIRRRLIESLADAALWLRIRLSRSGHWLATRRELDAGNWIRALADDPPAANSRFMPLADAARALSRVPVRKLAFPIGGRARLVGVLPVAFIAGIAAAFLTREQSMPPQAPELSAMNKPPSVVNVARSAPISASAGFRETETAAPSVLVRGIDGPPETPLVLPSLKPAVVGPTESPPRRSSELESTAAVMPPTARPAGKVLFTPTPRPARAGAIAAEPARRGFAVQLAAGRTQPDLMRLWRDLRNEHEPLLADHAPLLIDRAEPGALIRLRVGGFAGKSEADALCAALKRQQANCFVVAPTG